jgi:hypothetical protein
MEIEQLIIITFLMKEGLNSHVILDKLPTHFYERADAFRTTRFWMGEVQ